MAVNQPFATVVTVIGKAQARDANGNLRDIKSGDTLMEGETVITQAGARVELAYGDGQHLFMQPDQSVTLTADLSESTFTDATDAELTDDTIEEIITALEQGGEIDDLLEAPAAGLEGGDSGEGHDFVRLLRIVEEVSPLAFQFDNSTVPNIEPFGGVQGLDNEEEVVAEPLPPVATPDTATTPEDTPITIAVLDNDSDPEGEALSIVSVAGTPIAVGSPVNIPEGEVSLNPDGTLTFTPNPDINGPVDFPYTITDGTDTDTAVVSINVTPVNDGPDAVADSGTTPEDTPITIAVLDNDGDPENDPLTVTHVDGTPISVGNPVTITEGEVSLNANGTLTFTPNPDFNGPVDFPYTITDGDESDTAQVSITVTPVNDGPQANADVRDLGEDDASISGNVIDAPNTGEQADTDPDSDPLTVSAVAFGGTAGTVGAALAGDYGTLTLNDDGSYSYAPNAAAQALDDGETGTDIFTYTITDGDLTSTTTLTINVTGSNDGPIIVEPAPVSVTEEALPGGIEEGTGSPDTTEFASVTGTVSASDMDGDALSFELSPPTIPLTSGGDPVSWTGSGTGTLTASAGGQLVATLTIDSDGEYNFTLSAPLDHPDDETEDALALDFGVTVSDGQLSDSTVLTVSVEDDSPVIEGTEDVQLEILDGSEVTGLLGVSFGADGPNDDTAVQLSGIVDADGFAIDSEGNRLTADGEYLVYEPDGNGGLVAVKASDSGYTAFTVTVDVDTASYTVTIVDGIDGASFTHEVPLNSGNELINGGNDDLVTIDLDFEGDGTLDAYLYTTGTTGGSVSTVNYNTNAMGVGTGSKINGGDELRLEVRDYGAGGHTGTEPLISVSSMQVAFWHLSAGEVGLWTAIRHDENGDEIVVGSGDFDTTDLVNGLLTIDPAGGDFDTIVFGSEDSGNGYGVASISLNANVAVPGVNYEVDFLYTATDADGDSVGGEFSAGFVGADDDTAGTLNMAMSSEEALAPSLDNTLIGTEESDVFVWTLADAGTPGDPAVDTVLNFDTQLVVDDGDALDLRDLLQGEDANNLTDYLHFEQSGADTVIQISSEGNFSGGYDAGQADQTIVLQGVDLTGGGSLMDNQIIADMIQKGNLLTDS